jgi:hypothetical protein
LFPPLTAALVLLLVVFFLEFNRPDVAAPHPRLPQLISAWAYSVIARINSWAIREQWEVSIPRGAVIGEVP